MHVSNRGDGNRLGLVSLAAALLFLCASAGAAGPVASASLGHDELWRSGIQLVERGQFAAARETFHKIGSGVSLADQVRGWLDEYHAELLKRREIDRADFEKYVGYAKARIEREEYDLALGWSLAAIDCIEDRTVLLRSEWFKDLVNRALATADKARNDGEWRDAWSYYAQLGDIYEHEPRYRKLENEMLTHLRLDSLFKDDDDWKERIEHVRWKDGKKALEHIGLYYVEPPEFKKMAEGGLENLLLLAESKAARERLEGLQRDSDREEFVSRVQARLDQVRNEPTLDRRGATEHFRRVIYDINRQTVQLPEELVVAELMRGALQPLDEFTTIIWPSESDEFDKHTRGDFIGVGISIVKNRVTDDIEVVSPLEGAPAYYAGIQAGDVIHRVDGESLTGFSLTKVVDTITGPEGTPVTLTIRRGEKELEFPLVREKIRIRSVKGINRDQVDGERWNHWVDEENGIAYIRIANFQSNTQEDVENALSELQAHGLRGLVLDLRWNPGGLLDSAYGISKLFLKKGGNVVSTKGRNRSENQQLDVNADGAYSDLPIVVLTDESSASASEIVAGAVRDNNQGTVVGTRTFGKFSVQNLIPLGHSTAKLKITTARYYLPSGVSLHREPSSETWGVEPDIPVRLVRWERYNVRKLRRDADLLGPPKPAANEDQAHSEEVDGPVPSTEDSESDGPVHKSTDDNAESQVANAEDSAKDELPPLEQPDENNRPEEDPQLEAALLLMRVKLLGSRYPTLATASDPSSAVQQEP